MFWAIETGIHQFRELHGLWVQLNLNFTDNIAAQRLDVFFKKKHTITEEHKVNTVIKYNKNINTFTEHELLQRYRPNDQQRS